ncbi:hypothetical protein HID58_009620, partial [Brassica napus]
MGSCVSSPLKGSPFGKRPVRRRNNSHSKTSSSNPKFVSSTNLSRRLLFQPPSRVLPEPIGDGILLKYELGKELGRGEFGVTHECIEITTRKRDPWPKVSKEAKQLVKSMLDANPYSRLTVQEVLEHPWIQNAERAPNVNLGDNVRTNIQQFVLMNRFKKKVLRIVADNLPNEEIAAIVQMFETMDTDK